MTKKQSKAIAMGMGIERWRDYNTWIGYLGDSWFQIQYTKLAAHQEEAYSKFSIKKKKRL